MPDVNVEAEGKILRIVLNRPSHKNALRPEMMKVIADSLNRAGETAELRVVHLSGAGDSFCAGADLEWMSAAGALSTEENIRDAGILKEMYTAFVRCPLPVVAQLHGAVYGGGVGLAAASDIVAADAATRFCLSEARVGLVPGLISPFVVQKAGMGKFLEWSMTTRPFSAQEALVAGMVNFTGEAGQVDQFVKDCCLNIIENAAGSIRQIKSLTWGMNDPIETIEHLDLVRLIAFKRTDDEGRSGLAKFNSRRR